MPCMLKPNGKVRKSYVIEEKLANKVSFEAIQQNKFERDVIEQALIIYFARKEMD